MSPKLAEDPRSFWNHNQPGMRFATAELGTPAFFEEAEQQRYALEPAIPELADFATWRGRDVLEVGCGIATDGANFARNGARYTGVDLSPTAIKLATARFQQEGIAGAFDQASASRLPFAHDMFDLVYSCGVIHHIPETESALREFHRVLRPGGRALVMVYHRNSLNYYVTIMLIRRLLAGLLLIPSADRFLARATHENVQILAGHRQLLLDHRLRYLRDHQLFLDNNTDGPGNPLSKVHTAEEMRAMFSAAGFRNVRTIIRYLNLRIYPAGQRLSQSAIGHRLERRYGWHLWIDAAK